MSIVSDNLSDGSKAFEAKLIEANEIFRGVIPEDMTFREPATLKSYRGLYRKSDENVWKYVSGSDADTGAAFLILCAMGLKPTQCDAPNHMFAIQFDGPEGA